jgi:hypothetical protein
MSVSIYRIRSTQHRHIGKFPSTVTLYYPIAPSRAKRPRTTETTSGLADNAAPPTDFCALEWLAMTIFSAMLMLSVGLLTASTINQALVVLGGYAFVLAGKVGGEW